uniref:hypothetical protein n=1 Tax=unclassified Methylobacterium TaxID=2615210 RepID=UPI00226A5C7A
ALTTTILPPTASIPSVAPSKTPLHALQKRGRLLAVRSKRFGRTDDDRLHPPRRDRRHPRRPAYRRGRHGPSFGLNEPAGAGGTVLGPRAYAAAKVPELDRVWAEATRLYSVAEAAHPHPDPRIFNLKSLKEAHERIVLTPEWQAYLTARVPADALDNQLEETVSPFMDLPMVSLLGILLKHRIGMTLGQYEDDAQSDISRLAQEVLCA